MVYETLLKLAIAKGVWEELDDDYLGWDETAIEYLKKCEGEVEYNEGSIWLSITGTPKMEEDCIEYQAKVRYKNVPEFTVTYEQEYNEILERGAGDAIDELELWLSSRIDKYLASKGVNEKDYDELDESAYESIYDLMDSKGVWEELDDDYLGWDETSINYLKSAEGEVEDDFGKYFISIKGTPKMEEDLIEYQAEIKSKEIGSFSVKTEMEYNDHVGAKRRDIIDDIEFNLQGEIDKVLNGEGVNEDADLRTEIVDCLLKGSFDDDFGFLISGGGRVGNGEIAFKVNAQFGPEDLPQNDDEESFWINYLLELEAKGGTKKIKFQAEIFVGTDNQEQAEMLAEFIEEEINAVLGKNGVNEEDCDELDEAGELKISKEDLKNAIINGVYSKKIPEIMLSCFTKKDDDYILIEILKNDNFTNPDYFYSGDDVELSYMFNSKKDGSYRQGTFVVEYDDIKEFKEKFPEEVAEYVFNEYQ